MKKSKKKKKIKIKAFNIILGYAKEYKKRIIFFVFLLLITNLVGILTGYFMGEGTEALTNGNYKYSFIFLSAFLLVELFTYCVGDMVTYFLNKYQIRICRKLSYDTYIKTLNLPAIAFEKMSSGEIINRVTKDTESILGLIQTTINFLCKLVGSIIIYIYICFNSWIIGLEIFIVLVFFIYPLRFFKKKLKESDEQTRKDFDKFTQVTVESVRGIREIKTLGLKNRLNTIIKSNINDLIKSSTRNNFVYIAFYVIDSFFYIVLEGVVFLTSIYLVSKGIIPLSFFIAMTYYIYRFASLLDSTVDFYKNIESVSVSLERVGAILNNKLYKDVEYGVRELNNPEGVIRFNDVTFHYPKEKDVLKGFNVEFRPNMKIAIVGSSGGGKTTIFNLLTRLFDPIKGKITLDGVNLVNLTEKSLRDNISIIRQDPFIFNKTILENFKIIDDNLTLEEIRHYCKLASIDDYIMSLPKKYDTLLGEGGVNLSGGQKQRIAIARTLVKKSKVILFDEATSALDNETQDIVKDTISELVSDHTVIIIAHRLETIIDADIIYVIDSGKVIDAGTHKQLLKRCEYYKKLYKNRDNKSIL